MAEHLREVVKVDGVKRVRETIHLREDKRGEGRGRGSKALTRIVQTDRGTGHIHRQGGNGSQMGHNRSH